MSMADVTARIAEVEAERDKLQRFKDYVHARLDAAGVSTDPDSPHRAEGCRIGGRMDELIGQRDSLRAQMAGRPDAAAPGDQWAIVELMGHVRLAGKLTEEERFGAKMGRLEIPQRDGSFVTRMFGGSSVYSITYVDEAAARAVAAYTTVQPVNSWELPKQIAAAVITDPAATATMRRPPYPDDDDDRPF